MTTAPTAAAKRVLIVATRCAHVRGKPERHLRTGAPWRRQSCADCHAPVWTSANARKLGGADPLLLCEECAGFPPRA